MAVCIVSPIDAVRIDELAAVFKRKLNLCERKTADGDEKTKEKLLQETVPGCSFSRNFGSVSFAEGNEVLSKNKSLITFSTENISGHNAGDTKPCSSKKDITDIKAAFLQNAKRNLQCDLLCDDAYSSRISQCGIQTTATQPVLEERGPGRSSRSVNNSHRYNPTNTVRSRRHELHGIEQSAEHHNDWETPNSLESDVNTADFTSSFISIQEGVFPLSSSLNSAASSPYQVRNESNAASNKIDSSTVINTPHISHISVPDSSSVPDNVWETPNLTESNVDTFNIASPCIYIQEGGFPLSLSSNVAESFPYEVRNEINTSSNDVHSSTLLNAPHISCVSVPDCTSVSSPEVFAEHDIVWETPNLTDFDTDALNLGRNSITIPECDFASSSTVSSLYRYSKETNTPSFNVQSSTLSDVPDNAHMSQITGISDLGAIQSYFTTNTNDVLNTEEVHNTQFSDYTRVNMLESELSVQDLDEIFSGSGSKIDFVFPEGIANSADCGDHCTELSSANCITPSITQCAEFTISTYCNENCTRDATAVGANTSSENASSFVNVEKAVHSVHKQTRVNTHDPLEQEECFKDLNNLILQNLGNEIEHGLTECNSNEVGTYDHLSIHEDKANCIVPAFDQQTLDLINASYVNDCTVVTGNVAQNIRNTSTTSSPYVENTSSSVFRKNNEQMHIPLCMEEFTDELSELESLCPDKYYVLPNGKASKVTSARDMHSVHNESDMSITYPTIDEQIANLINTSYIQCPVGTTVSGNVTQSIHKASITSHVNRENGPSKVFENNSEQTRIPLEVGFIYGRDDLALENQPGYSEEKEHILLPSGKANEAATADDLSTPAEGDASFTYCTINEQIVEHINMSLSSECNVGITVSENISQNIHKTNAPSYASLKNTPSSALERNHEQSDVLSAAEEFIHDINLLVPEKRCAEKESLLPDSCDSKVTTSDGQYNVFAGSKANRMYPPAVECDANVSYAVIGSNIASGSSTQDTETVNAASLVPSFTAPLALKPPPAVLLINNFFLVVSPEVRQIATQAAAEPWSQQGRESEPTRIALKRVLDPVKELRYQSEIYTNSRRSQRAIHVVQKSTKWTNLHIAAINGDKELVFCLVEIHYQYRKQLASLAINALDKYGKTARHYAAVQNNTLISDYLSACK